MEKISLYIHIPFCKQKCFYCDFASYSGKDRFRSRYIKALKKEIKEKCSNYIIETIFIGGGTPSYLEAEELKDLLESIKSLNLHKDIEFSVECNPGTVDEEKFIVLKNGGVNRLSFGLQSSSDSLLKEIGRIHNYNEFVENYNKAREVGFKNINIDLMYGLPNQSIEDWKVTLENICKIKPEHISAYSLIVEEGTPFYNMYEKELLNLPSEDDEREMDSMAIDILKRNGYLQYEISNYSLEGLECRHNKVYWEMKNYIGVGSASSSYIDGVRYSNVEDIEDYINRVEEGLESYNEKYKNLEEDDMEEFMFMGLRLKEGIDINGFENRFRKSIFSIYKNEIDKNIENGLLIKKDNRLYLSEEGRMFSNNVMSDFIISKN